MRNCSSIEGSLHHNLPQSQEVLLKQWMMIDDGNILFASPEIRGYFMAVSRAFGKPSFTIPDVF